MPRTAIGTIVVARARPFVGPFRTATIASVVVAIPSQNQPLCTGITTANRNKDIKSLQFSVRKR
jgi:hypothetical protein